ncbi:hypothetical protein TNCT_548201 [Trichonephila clavata]|uniref:Uncharacterized protein n=1 Tax=Trichonephila clavata TaxID=2740835 RepID=A0A8X6F421_TRICU|nr:hypothetical protein TNCT_548201 [Trichonephila clavata]
MDSSSFNENSKYSTRNFAIMQSGGAYVQTNTNTTPSSSNAEGALQMNITLSGMLVHRNVNDSEQSEGQSFDKQCIRSCGHLRS